MEIELNATDNPFERARKAWEVMGFANQSGNCIGSLAEVFMAYQKFDRQSSVFAPPSEEP